MSLCQSGRKTNVVYSLRDTLPDFFINCYFFDRFYIRRIGSGIMNITALLLNLQSKNDFYFRSSGALVKVSCKFPNKRDQVYKTWTLDVQKEGLEVKQMFADYETFDLAIALMEYVDFSKFDDYHENFPVLVNTIRKRQDFEVKGYQLSYFVHYLYEGWYIGWETGSEEIGLLNADFSLLLFGFFNITSFRLV